MNILDNHPFFFYVGKNEQGISDLNEYGELYKEHLLQIPIKYKDIDNLWNLIFALNEGLSLLIDVCEDETIKVDMLPKALKIANEILAKEQDASKKVSISKFISAIETAISYNSPLLIWW